MLSNCGAGEDFWESLGLQGDQTSQSWRKSTLNTHWRTDAEAPVLWPPDVKSRLIGRDPDAGKDWGQEEKEATEDEMAGWHHWLNGHEFEQTLGEREGQGSLVCCNPWGHRVAYDLVTEQQFYVTSMNLESSPCEIRTELCSSTMVVFKDSYT